MASTEEPSTEERIMEATFRVLADVGYSDLSIRRIADEFDGSQSLIYYHYDDKEDLLAGFLSYLIEALEDEIAAIDVTDPTDRLVALVDLVIPRQGDPEHLSFHQALQEVRTQTPYHERYHDRFVDLETTLQAEIETTVRRGIDEGVFAAVDAAEAADRLMLFLSGVSSRFIPLRDWEGIERGRELIEAEIESWRAA